MFKQKYWTSSEFGPIEGRGELPLKIPEPRGFGFTGSAKVDARCSTRWMED